MYCEGITPKGLMLCSDDGGDDFDTSGLIESLANNATQAYDTTQALNANPLNTALIYGGTAQTQQGIVGSASAVSNSSMTWILLLLALLGIGYVVVKR
jgi:hypothetical protein